MLTSKFLIVATVVRQQDAITQYVDGAVKKNYVQHPRPHEWNLLRDMTKL